MKPGLFVFLGWIATFLPAAAARADTPVRSFTPGERRRIDDHALWSSREKLNPGKVEATGSVLEWLVVHSPLPADEEQRRSADEYRRFTAKSPTTAAPPEAQKILQQLVAQIPARMFPGRDRCQLVTVPDAQPVARLVGGEHVVVDQRWLDAAVTTPQGKHAQVAFVVAGELGHACLGHARRRMQRAWLEEELRKEAQRKSGDVARTLTILKNLAGVGTILEYVYTREEEYQADLFALHLCRNAGFDVEAGLDAVRAAAVQRNRGLLDAPPPRSGDPPVEPEVQPQTGPEALSLADPPSPAHRLRRLRLELDGLLFGERFGLFEYHRATQTLRRADDAAVAADERAIVCIHGMESSGDVYRPLLERLAAHELHVKTRLFVFQYPADDSLARSGRALERELRRVAASTAKTDFVCHSAGGLVFRYFAEVRGGDFRQAVFLGTPHQGSNLAKLRRLLEVVQFIGDLKLGYDQALQKAILDGRGQITFDLAPDSLFLSYLNQPRENLHRDRYAIHRGRVLTRTRALLLQAAVEASRVALVRSLGKAEESTLTRFALAATDALTVPAEIADGDLCVQSDSALLDGVNAVATHTLMHTALPRDAEVISQIVERLTAER